MTNPRTIREVADLEWQMERWKAERVTCPRCRAAGREDLPPKPDGGEPNGEHCQGTKTDEELAAPAHWQRITEAKRGDGS